MDILAHNQETPPRVTPGQAATLTAIISHAADTGLPLPTDDFVFPEAGESLVLPVANVEEVTAWCQAFQDDDQRAHVLTDRIDRLTSWWTAGLFLDIPVLIRAESIDWQAEQTAAKPHWLSDVALVPLLDRESLVRGGVA